MTMDWNADFGNGDPFGASADVFGRSVEEVDVWKGHDSFDGDQEWMDYNAEFDEEPNAVDKERGLEKEATRNKGEESKPRRKKSPKEKSSRQKSPRQNDSAKPKRRTKKEKPEKAKQSSRHLGNLLDDTDPFNVGVEGSSVSTPTSTEEHSHRHRKSAVNDGFGEVGSPTDSAERPRRASTSVKPPRQRRSSAYTDDAIASQFRTGSSSGASSSRKLLSKNTERKGDLVRRRDGTVARQRPREHNHRADQSGRRRGAVRDSLFAAVGEEGNAATEISLSSFLRVDSQASLGSQAEAKDTGSVKSAPAITTGGGKSRRFNRRKNSSPIKQEPLKLDIAQLAKAGYIEVHNGKMRLVIDVEP